VEAQLAKRRLEELKNRVSAWIAEHELIVEGTVPEDFFSEGFNVVLK
jgi:hypothetical protein